MAVNPHKEIGCEGGEAKARYLSLLMAEKPAALAASQIQCLTTKACWPKKHPPTLVAVHIDPARSGEKDLEEEALQHDIDFMTDLRSNHDNFLDLVSMFSAGGSCGPWGERHCAAFKKTGVLFRLTLPFWGLSVMETSLKKHPLRLVNAEDIQPGTVQHSVVKIITWFKGGECTIGTGVVIDKSIVVTVGHVLVSKHGHAIAVKVTAGEGYTSESRCGRYAAVHGNWYALRARFNDLGFIKLDKPFDTVQPLDYEQTPIANDSGIFATIYGFPKDTATFTPGGRLSKSKSPIQYSLISRMIEHEGDTEEGNSGSPLIDTSGRVIALHSRYGDNMLGKEVNLAVTIDHDGNNFAAFLQVLNSKQPISHSAIYREKQNADVTEVRVVKDVDGFVFAW